MVVVSASWMKNVANHPPSIINSEIVPSNDKKMAKAILICRPNSHHFQERTLLLDQPIKIGRSVARAKPTSTNAIFDCKVLSRHHALLWYEDGKFYLQDTKSSNGTFVNNNKLSAESENHELSSGDIVQFGVDVVENNRKVTHGCIIATIKLYLPDGKEAKASPSITDSDRHGAFGLDDLYRLNQVIQEAHQREQCLETKLTALQHIVNETRKSAEESWQAYVGEERLLSRVSALENQLQQVNKNWSEDRLREELTKLKEDNEAYQIAAKEALEKLHTERLQAVGLAMEQERSRIAAEQETLLAKEQFTQTQLELEEVAKKLAEHQNKSEEQKIKLEKHAHELEAKLEAESDKVLDLQLKLHDLNVLSIQNESSFENTEEKANLIYSDVKFKQALLTENQISNSVLSKSNGSNNHISLMVCPVIRNDEFDNTFDDKLKSTNPDIQINQKNDFQEDIKQVTFKISEDSEDINDTAIEIKSIVGNKDKDSYCNENVDSKTLKYQFQSAQNELKKKMELLEIISTEHKCKVVELEKALNEERTITIQSLKENEFLKQELIIMQQKWNESCNENQQYKNKMQCLEDDLDSVQKKLDEVDEHFRENHMQNDLETPLSSKKIYSYSQLVNLEEELVLLKERFAQIGEEKVQLQRDLLTITEKYNMACNHSYNKYFFYVAPLVFMVLYLLISAMIS